MIASGQPVAARCPGCLFLSWVPLLSPVGKKTSAKWGEWRKTFLNIWYLEVINKNTDTFDYGKVCIKPINHQASNRKFAIHITDEGPGRSPSNQPLSPQKTEETRQFKEVPSLTYHKVNINSNCKGLCFRPREAVIRSPPPAQTNWEAGSAGLWPLRKTDTLKGLCLEGTLGTAQGRQAPTEPPPWDGHWDSDTKATRIGGSVWKEGTGHETNLRTIRLKNRV